MGTTNYGNQSIQWQYYDPLNSDEFDKHNQDIIPVGIYKGGLIALAGGNDITIATLVCMISDGTQAARIATTTPIALTIAQATPYVCLTWTWAALTNWFMDVTAKASPAANDIVVGKGIYVMGVLDHIDYLETTTPNTMGNFLQPKAQPVANMTVHVTPGWVSYGASRIPLIMFDSAAFNIAALTPGQYRTDLLYIDSGGSLVIVQGTAGSYTPPNHSGKVVICEVSLIFGQVAIVQSDITDCRPWINIGGAGGVTGINASFLTMGA